MGYVSLRLPDELHNKLKKESIDLNINLRDYIINILDKCRGEEGFK